MTGVVGQLPAVASIPPPPVTVFELGPVDVHVFGIVVAVAVLAGITVTRRRYARFGGDPELIDGILVKSVLAGFVGARLAYVSTNLDRYVEHPLGVVMIWNGGLALFGGLTVGTAVAVWLARRACVDVSAFAAAAAVGVPLAQAIGRPADYFSQELYGTPSTLPWAVQVPPASRPEGFAEAATFHPAFFYESLWSLAIVAAVVWLERSGRLTGGRLFFVYMAAYGTGRFVLEQIRTDTTFQLLGLSRNGWVALLLTLAAAAALWFGQVRSRAVLDRTVA